MVVEPFWLGFAVQADNFELLWELEYMETSLGFSFGRVAYVKAMVGV